ncbi:NUDIX hydrolase [Candidatus Saccharibacteria bacterium]|nr:MAG: NUDIX hydrolase [Candidatus Saccharibacteria bacterium]
MYTKRALNVSHPGLWDQSAGGHVDEDEDYITAAKRELYEEIGIKNIKLHEVTRYYSDFEYEGSIMKRFNTLYTAVSDQTLTLDQGEVAGGKWLSPGQLITMMAAEPDKFTKGFINAYKIYRSTIGK